MLNVCARCGEYRADKIIDPAGPYAVCPDCGHEHAFLRLPLLVVGGASGAGKSAVCRRLIGTLSDVVLLDGDILWRDAFNTPEDNYRDFFETWLRLAKNISQSGRPVVLFNAGMAVPGNVEPCVERRYFSAVHYLALVCDDDLLAERLRQRPAWCESGSPAWIVSQVEFNRWFKAQADEVMPPIDLLDTTEATVAETAASVAAWIRRKTQSS
jgi:broad-specificity NMP kinase